MNGDYRKEHLLVLKQEFESYNFYQRQIEDLDKTIKACYQEMDKKENKEPLKKKERKSPSSSNVPKFALRESLHILLGIDFTAIPGLNELRVQAIQQKLVQI